MLTSNVSNMWMLSALRYPGARVSVWSAHYQCKLQWSSELLRGTFFQFTKIMNFQLMFLPSQICVYVTQINYFQCLSLLFTVTPCMMRTYITLGKHKGKENHVNTIINYSVKEGSCLLNTLTWTRMVTVSATPQSGVATPPQQRKMISVHLASIQPVSNRQACVAQMCLETQLEGF